MQVPVDLGAEGSGPITFFPGGLPAAPDRPGDRPHLPWDTTSWRDPAITALNPGINIPDARISVEHCSDGSGTTYIFSNYLSSLSPSWAAKVGAGKTLKWPVGEGCRRQWRGGSFGLPHPCSPSDTSSSHIRKACSCPPPPSATRPAATSSHPSSPPPRTPPKNPLSRQPTSRSSTSPAPAVTPSPDTAGHSSMPTSPTRATGHKLVSLLDWLTHAGQTYAAATSYVPLPTRIPATRPHHAPASHRARWNTPAGLSATPHPDSSELELSCSWGSRRRRWWL